MARFAWKWCWWGNDPPWHMSIAGVKSSNVYSPGNGRPNFINRPRISNGGFSEVHIRQKEWEKMGRIEKNGTCSENKFPITLIIGLKKSTIPL